MKLEWLYRSCAILASLSLIAIVLIILAQIFGRLLGIVIPSADDFAGYFMSASIFLALAPTLRAGGHIRVTMLIHNLPKKATHVMELFCVSVGTFFSGYFAWYMINMVRESFRFNELSQGYISTPLWIPQSALAFGTIVLFIAFVEELWHVLRGHTPIYEQQPADHKSPIASE